MKSEAIPRYVASYHRDEDGIWCGSAQLGPQSFANAQGTTLEAATERMREAIALALDVPVDAFELNQLDTRPLGEDGEDVPHEVER